MRCCSYNCGINMVGGRGLQAVLHGDQSSAGQDSANGRKSGGTVGFITTAAFRLVHSHCDWVKSPNLYILFNSMIATACMLQRRPGRGVVFCFFATQIAAAKSGGLMFCTILMATQPWR